MKELGEKRFLSELVLPAIGRGNALVGPGDDAAILTVTSDLAVAISTDRIGENLVALKLGLMSCAELGRYCAVANLSDLYAMGVKPTGFLMNLGLPSDFSSHSAMQIIKGAAQYCCSVGAALVGGDTKQTSVLSVVGVAVGSTPACSVLRRSGGDVGDSVFVTGPIGLFAAALLYFAVAEPKGAQLKPQQRSLLRRALCRPTLPQFDPRRLAALGCKSCMDVTDGLGYTLLTLAEASDVAIEVDADCIPVHPAVQAVADLLGLSGVDVCLSVGADFALVGSVGKSAEGELLSSLPQARHIGRFTDASNSTIAVRGCKRPLQVIPFEQFQLDVSDLLTSQFANFKSKDLT